MPALEASLKGRLVLGLVCLKELLLVELVLRFCPRRAGRRRWLPRRCCCWLAGWLAAWVAGGLDGWLAGWLAGWTADRLVCWLAGGDMGTGMGMLLLLRLAGWLAVWVTGWEDG